MKNIKIKIYKKSENAITRVVIKSGSKIYGIRRIVFPHLGKGKSVKSPFPGDFWIQEMGKKDKSFFGKYVESITVESGNFLIKQEITEFNELINRASGMVEKTWLTWEDVSCELNFIPNKNFWNEINKIIKEGGK